MYKVTNRSKIPLTLCKADKSGGKLNLLPNKSIFTESKEEAEFYKKNYATWGVRVSLVEEKKEPVKTEVKTEVTNTGEGGEKIPGGNGEGGSSEDDDITFTEEDTKAIRKMPMADLEAYAELRDIDISKCASNKERANVIIAFMEEEYGGTEQ